MFGMIILESVGCAFDPENGMIMPIMDDGTIDIENKTHLNECEDEWTLSLSDDDFDEIANFLTNN